jgi:glycosyltransferase involved in cell wall biosynthesis
MFPASPSRRFSLVVATLGRAVEMEPLLNSLVLQAGVDFEVVIVDQNKDDRLDAVIKTYGDRLDIKHVRTPLPGVCRARNLGAGQATGDWLMFPDDDCWYPQDFFLMLGQIMDGVEADFYSGRATNMAGQTIMGSFADVPAPVTRDNIWVTLIEWLVVIRRSSFVAAGGFDERIGPGSGTIWGAYEIQDLILKCLAQGAKGHYSPDLTGHHPEDRNDQTTPENIAKMYRYSAGLGYVMRGHGFSALAFLPRLLRPLAGMVVYRLSGRSGMARRSAQILRGRIDGWRSAPNRHGSF